MSREERPFEQEAVRTTIVGGRPPGSGKAVGPIPRGIEVLVKKAAVDPSFKQTLLDRRAKAADEIALKLEPAEVAMLNAVPVAQLETIIANTEVADLSRAAFLGRAAAVMLAALGVSAMNASAQEGPAVTGVRPEPPPPKPKPEPDPDKPVSKGIQPDKPDPGPTSRGVRPDRPQTRGIRPNQIPAPTLSAEEIKKRVDAMVVLLGNTQYNIRVEARQALLGMGPAALPVLKTAKAPNFAAEKEVKEITELLEAAKAKR